MYCLERDYHIGAAATLLDAASPDKIYWVNSGNIEHYYWGEESEHLQAWLSQGWSYDELLADPLLTELERQKNILKHRQNDISVSDQIKKYIDFQNNQKKASEIKPVIGE